MTSHLLDALFIRMMVKTVMTTLLHSLWIGTVMTALAGVIIVVTQKRSAALRYNLLTGLLGIFLVSMVYVFFNAIDTNVTISSSDYTINSLDFTGQIQVVPQQTGILKLFSQFIATNADSLVLIWFVVILLKCIQLMSGLYGLHHLRNRNVMQAGSLWNNRMGELSAKIGITKTVLLLQSSAAKIPMIIGHFKPVILFPLGVLNALAPHEVEAILLHELAHIKRNDFLVNMLQRFVEILFFFNPAVLWLSSLIKNERENCCDDIAISITNDRKEFIHALVSFREYNAAQVYATTFPGSKNHLLNRIKRIITQNNKTLNNMEKGILAAVVVVSCFATLAFSSVNVTGKKLQKSVPLPEVLPAIRSTANGVDQTPVNTVADQLLDQLLKEHISAGIQNRNDTGTRKHYSGVIDGKKIELTEEDDKIKELYIEGKRIPGEQYALYKDIVDQVHQEMARNAAELNNRAFRETEALESQLAAIRKVDSIKEQSELLKQRISTDQIRLKQEQSEMQEKAAFLKERVNNTRAVANARSLNQQTDILKREEDLNRREIELQKKTEQLNLQRERLHQMRMDTTKIKRLVKVSTVTNVAPVLNSVSVVNVKSASAVKPVIAQKVVTNINVIAPVKAVNSAITAVYTSTSSISEQIIGDLEDADIITTEKNLTFRLSNDELIVNGVKQSPAIHQKILRKYAGKPGDKLTVSYNNQQ